MYGNYGSLSGIVHLTARRPVLAATVALAVIAVAYTPRTAPPPPSPLPPAVVTYAATVPPAATDPKPVVEALSRKETFYTCEFGKAVAPTNLCKATLDSIALFLQNDSDAKLTVEGSIDHATAIRRYFVEGESKLGIASNRIALRVNGDSGNTVTITQIQ